MLNGVDLIKKVQVFGQYAPLLLIGPNAELTNGYIERRTESYILTREDHDHGPPKFHWLGWIKSMKILPNFILVSGYRGCGKSLLVFTLKSVIESETNSKVIYKSFHEQYGATLDDVVRTISNELSLKEDKLENIIEKAIEEYDNLVLILDDIDEVADPIQVIQEFIKTCLNRDRVFLIFTSRPYVAERVVNLLEHSPYGFDTVIMQKIGERPLAEIRRRLLYIKIDHYPILMRIFERDQNINIVEEWIKDLILKLYIIFEINSVDDLKEKYETLVEKSRKLWDKIVSSNTVISSLCNARVDNFTARWIAGRIYERLGRYVDEREYALTDIMHIINEIVKHAKSISFRSEFYWKEAFIRQRTKAELVEYFQYGLYVVLRGLLKEDVSRVSSITISDDISILGTSLRFLRLLRPRYKTYERIIDMVKKGEIGKIIIITTYNIGTKLLSKLQSLKEEELKTDVYILYIESMSRRTYSILATLGKVAVEQGLTDDLIRKIKAELKEDLRLIAEDIFMLDYRRYQPVKLGQFVGEIQQER